MNNLIDRVMKAAARYDVVAECGGEEWHVGDTSQRDVISGGYATPACARAEADRLNREAVAAVLNKALLSDDAVERAARAKSAWNGFSFDDDWLPSAKEALLEETRITLTAAMGADHGT